MTRWLCAARSANEVGTKLTKPLAREVSSVLSVLSEGFRPRAVTGPHVASVATPPARNSGHEPSHLPGPTWQEPPRSAQLAAHLRRLPRGELACGRHEALPAKTARRLLAFMAREQESRRGHHPQCHGD
jgi:hypothetical protein